MTTPTDFSNNIQTYSTKFPGILDNFIQAFKNHLKNPADTSTTSIYGASESNLHGIISDLFVKSPSRMTGIYTGSLTETAFSAFVY